MSLMHPDYNVESFSTWTSLPPEYFDNIKSELPKRLEDQANYLVCSAFNFMRNNFDDIFVGPKVEEVINHCFTEIERITPTHLLPYITYRINKEYGRKYTREENKVWYQVILKHDNRLALSLSN